MRMKSGLSNEDLVLTFIDPPGFERTPGRPSDFESLLINGISDWFGNEMLRAWGIGSLKKQLISEDLLEWSVMYPSLSHVPDRVFGIGGDY